MKLMIVLICIWQKTTTSRQKTSECNRKIFRHLLQMKENLSQNIKSNFSNAILPTDIFVCVSCSSNMTATVEKSPHTQATELTHIENSCITLIPNWIFSFSFSETLIKLTEFVFPSGRRRSGKARQLETCLLLGYYWFCLEIKWLLSSFTILRHFVVKRSRWDAMPRCWTRWILIIQYRGF